MFTFAGCRLDVAGRTLVRAGEPQHLEPQAFDVLVHLVVHRDRVVPQEELLDEVWGGQFVTASALTTRIKEVRQATGDSGITQSVVRTVRGRGYRFVAEVGHESADDAGGVGIVGRDRDLAELARRLEPGSLVTVVGPGGVGKTTLAREVLGSVSGRFVDGVVVVDLSVLDDPGRLLPLVAHAAGIEDGSGSTVTEVLRRRRSLLVLDDADDLVADVADLCRALTGRITILVTSRERLGVRGERLWPLMPLDAAASRLLLATRVRDRAPRGSLADADGDTLDDLGRRVDRLPLALEMLASMSSVLGSSELLEVVGHRPDLIATRDRDVPQRHLSLERLVEASVSRLDQRGRHALLSVAEFVGPFGATEAAELIGGDDALLLVAELVDRSLLAGAGDAQGEQLQMLRTVRTVALASDDPREANDAARRHARLVLGRLRSADARLRTEDEPAAAQIFLRWADEARSAYSWARVHDPSLAVELTVVLHLYAYSRMWAEPALWSSELVVEGATPEPVLALLASQAAQEGRLRESRAIAEQLLASDDPLVRAWALEALSDVSIYLGELDRAGAEAAELIGIGRARRDGRALAIGVTDACLALAYGGRAREALRLLDDEEGRWDLPVAPSERAWLAYSRGESLEILGEPGATEALEAAAALGDVAGNRFVAGVARSTLAGVQRRLGDARASAATYADLLDSFSRHGNVTHLTAFLRDCVGTLSSLGELEPALVVAEWSLTQQEHRLWGVMGSVLDAEREWLRRSLGPVVSGSCATRGASLTITTATDLALEALRRHAAPATDPHCIPT